MGIGHKLGGFGSGLVVPVALLARVGAVCRVGARAAAGVAVVGARAGQGDGRAHRGVHRLQLGAVVAVWERGGLDRAMSISRRTMSTSVCEKLHIVSVRRRKFFLPQELLLDNT